MDSRALRQQDCSGDRTLRSSPSTRSLSTLASYTSQSSAYVYAGSPCGCDMTLVSDSQNRPGMPLRRGNIVWIHAHFLAALKPFLKETDLGPADVVDLTRSSSTASPSMRKNARPCVIWNLENEPGGTVDVLLAGTYEGTTYTNLPLELRNWVIGLFNESAIEDWMAIDHVHASPKWRKTATSWIIPLSVTVPTSALESDAYCKYINDASMSKLASFHAAMRLRYDSVLSQSPTRKKVARSLLDYSRIRTIMKKESPLYDAPSAVAGSSRYRPGQFSISSVPAPGDMHPPQKRRRYKGPEPPEQSHGAERGGRGADVRGGGSASSRRGASRSRGHGMYHRPADGGSAPSLNRNSAGHWRNSSLPLLSSQSSMSSLSSRNSQVSHTPSTSSYYTARSEFSDSSDRSRHVSDVSSELAFWSGSGIRESARARQELDALERRGSSVRAEKRKRSPPRTPTAPRAMRQAFPQTPVPAEVRPPTQPFPELPSLALPRPEALHLTLPERPRKPTAQPQQPFAPPETPRKTRTEAALLASFKKLSPPSLKNFGRRRSKENAETPTRERGDPLSFKERGVPLSPKEPSLRRSSRANSLCSSSRPNSTPSSPKTGKKASALMSPLNKVAHLLRVGGGRPASRAPSEDGRDWGVR